MANRHAPKPHKSTAAPWNNQTDTPVMLAEMGAIMAEHGPGPLARRSSTPQTVNAPVSVETRVTAYRPNLIAASDKQIAFITSLCEQIKRMQPEFDIDGIVPAEYGKREASGIIQTLIASKDAVAKSQPAKPAQTVSAPVKSEVPDGRYAVTGKEGQTVFYRVNTSKSSGRQYVILVVGGGNDRYMGSAQSVIKQIADAGPKDAMVRYGHEIGECGKCGRTLTDEESRRLGIGPICLGKLGW